MIRRLNFGHLLVALLSAGLTGVAVNANQTPQCPVSTDHAQVQAGFSGRSQPAVRLIVQAINGAQHQISVAAYSFTSKPISQALLAAKRRGLDVRIVADKKANTGRYTMLTFLANQGVPVRLNGRYSIMHDKFMVIDGHTVETGSFNFTAAAEKHNAENVLLLSHAPQLASQYAAEFKILWDEAQPFDPRY